MLPAITNITPKSSGFQVTKRIKNNKKYLGFGRTLIEALMIYDWCKQHNWEKYRKQDTPTYIFKENGRGYRVQKSFSRGGRKYTKTFGTFTKKEYAEAEVQLLKRYDWDYERLLLDDELLGTLK